jgi:hypothetical protein
MLLIQSVALLRCPQCQSMGKAYSEMTRTTLINLGLPNRVNRQTSGPVSSILSRNTGPKASKATRPTRKIRLAIKTVFPSRPQGKIKKLRTCKAKKTLANVNPRSALPYSCPATACSSPVSHPVLQIGWSPHHSVSRPFARNPRMARTPLISST